jgi:hypothetical protein
MTKMTLISDRHVTAEPNRALRALRPVSLALALASIALVTGCANYQSVKPGMSAAEAIQKLGKPSTLCTREDGSQRLIWTMQPYGQYAWGTNTTKDGKVVEMQQLLTDKHFEVLSTGKWTDQRLACEFGEPANKYGVAKGNEIVWAYRYKQDGAWNSMMYVYMGPQGNLVNRFHPAPDPDALDNGDRMR